MKFIKKPIINPDRAKMNWIPSFWIFNRNFDIIIPIKNNFPNQEFILVSFEKLLGKEHKKKEYKKFGKFKKYNVSKVAEL